MVIKMTKKRKYFRYNRQDLYTLLYV